MQQVRVSAAKVAWLNADCACARARVLAQLAALDAHIVELRQAFLKGGGASALEAYVLGDSIAPRRRAALGLGRRRRRFGPLRLRLGTASASLGFASARPGFGFGSPCIM